ncbi:hypothetical protein EGW08_002367 [Elysia chlorotica]|uniref:RRM domain-containing protein n=1 Tax=Elysia chlorotica TaxID=188477 RepID=A0A3S1BJL5_ELYCH|nr:hypothetical protein EGW08_002367 [Elysia chlorotica]
MLNAESDSSKNPAIMSSREGGQRNGMSPFGGCRVYVGDIGYIKRTELEKEFGQYGPVIDVWMGANRDTVGPNYAFVVFRYPEDAEEAVKDRNGRKVCGQTVRVEHARPARQRPIRKSFGFSRNFRRPYQRQWCQSRNRSNRPSKPGPIKRPSQCSIRCEDHERPTYMVRPISFALGPSKAGTLAPPSNTLIARKSNSGANKSKRKSSSSPSVSPRQSRHKGKQSSGSRISPSRSSSRSVSPPLMKKQTDGEKPQTRSDSASPKG